MVNTPAVVRSNGKKQSHGLESSDWCEDLVEVDARLLHVAFGDEASLVLDDVAILITLHFVHPFEAYGAVTTRELDQRPRLVVADRGQLLLHRGNPIWITVGLLQSPGLLHAHGVQLSLLDVVVHQPWCCTHAVDVVQRPVPELPLPFISVEVQVLLVAESQLVEQSMAKQVQTSCPV
ncbi:hypothetical protein U9M48_005100 [Paspalum notatum var. saurae]|uniref:Uncharacterized protein n=1 Tax=Paspalum notatum var. saurae TaxID=547442 RepID=A0AAQ3PW49_PASNO